MTLKDKKIIYDSERRRIPIFVITAKDKVSVEAIKAYKVLCDTFGCDRDFTDSVENKISDFEDWQKCHPDQVKLPD
jgi:hypothetical protein